MKQMKYFLFAAAVSVAAAPALASDVGVSISVGEPGFYGQINIGNMPAPQLIYQQPVMIQQAPVRALASSIGLTTTLAAAIKEAPGIVHHGEPDEDLNEAEAVEDEDEPQVPGLRRAPMRVGKGARDEEGALSSF